MKIVAFTALMFACAQVLGQGCSDAGFCTLDSFKPHADSAEFGSRLKIGSNVGTGDHSIFVFGSYLELNQSISKKLNADAKLTALSQSGNGIAVFGLSDLFFNINYAATDRLTFTAGAKVPLTDGNRTRNDLALPMDYQSSLGTFDLILGTGYRFRKLQFILAYQQPLTQNKNTFLAEEYPSDSPLSNFHSTNQFKRKGDVLVRLSYPLRVARKLTLTPSLLPIYHLGNDKYVDELNNTQEISDSKGLTLNATLYLDFAISNTSTFQINAGAPFIVREARPDGLTRSFVINLEYAVKF